MQKTETFEELIEKYDVALKSQGRSPASRLDKLLRVNSIIRRHENQGKEVLEGKIIADYFGELDQRHYDGKIGKHYWHNMRREIERFVNFVQSGEVVFENPLAVDPHRLQLPAGVDVHLAGFVRAVGGHADVSFGLA